MLPLRVKCNALAPGIRRANLNGARFKEMIRSHRGATPNIAPSAYIDPSAQLIGSITIGERSSVWPNVVIRGDINFISIGDESNVQDNSVLHCDPGEFRLSIGNRVTIGHLAMVHGCTIEDDCLIGIGAIILNGAHIGKGSVIAAGALVPEGMQVPPASMVMGVPAKIKRQVTEEEQARFRLNAQSYVENAKRYRDEPS
jgi:carbonic anhydrase/acetyltransferase-like protein (isoleucine patch superfamily)